MILLILELFLLRRWWGLATFLLPKVSRLILDQTLSLTTVNSTQCWVELSN